ncbi:MAG: protein kinase [Pseudomonadota bacterium]
MSDAASATPARLGDRYALIQRLHLGSQSEVWLARDERSGIPVAIKLLTPKAAKLADRVAAFEEEWRIARGLNHHHTVRALARVPGERPGYAMQYIDGTDFASLVATQPDVWLPAALVLIDTLDYWHRKGVVHGDIKPSNCLLDRRGAAYLGDFGCAQMIDTPRPVSCGSDAYASAEQRDAQPAHPHDDIFAFAQTCAELLNSEPNASFGERLPADVVVVLNAARGARGTRPSAAEIRDAFATAGVARGHVDLEKLSLKLRRPAATIAVDVEPPDVLPHGAFERAPQDAQLTPRQGVPLWFVVAGVVAIIALGVAMTWLFSAREATSPIVEQATEQQTETAAQSTSEEPATEPAPDPVARLAADEKVAALLSLVDLLETRNAATWAGSAFANGIADYQAGDRAYLARDYALAQQRYASALEQLQPIADSIPQRYDSTMREADAQMLAGDAAAALAAFELGLLLKPGDDTAITGIERAKSLDELLALMSAGRIAEREGDWTVALARFEAALALNPDWQPAIDGSARMRQAISADAFSAQMSRGFAALEAGDFSRARRAFDAAASLRPGDPALEDARLQLRLAERLDRIGTLQARARQAEAQERWQTALTDYETVLSLDESLDAAREGAARVRNRQKIVNEMQAVLNNPDRLSETDALREASALLQRASDLQPRGPNLAATIDSLQGLLVRVALPIAVELRSDGLTEVTLLRVERLGQFASTEVRLRPGLYTVVGSRRGYQDVRRQFRVAWGQPGPSIYIACDRPI